MPEPAGGFFDQAFMPHGHCYLWTPAMVWTQVTSNFMIGGAYVSITLTLFALVRRIERIPFAGVFTAFAIFILSCGLTHFSDIVTVWEPVYWVDAGIRVVTATASVATALLVIPLVPKAVALADSAKLAAERGRLLEATHRELEAANAELARREETARKRAEQSEVQFRELIDNLPDLAWTARPDGHIDFYNRRWFEYTGTTAEEMAGWGWEKVHDPDVLPSVVEKWKECLATGTRFEMEFPMRRADGAYRWFLTRVSPLRDESGAVVRWFGSNTDVDDKRKAGEELARVAERERVARRDAEEATRTKDEFLAAVSHELRTPLNAILGWSRMLAAGQVKPDRVPRAIEVIERNVLAQVQIVDDLLDISRIITGKLRLDIQAVDLDGVVESAIESLRPAITAKDIQLEVVRDPNARSVAGDASRLQQVLWNIIGNAAKFSAKGGRIVVSSARASSHVEITVKDWGKGIATAFLPYVFERFRQEDGSTTRSYGGLGLGLAISKHIVELHGGELVASSEGDEKGATFVISLPLSGARGPETDGYAPKARVRLPSSSPPELAGVHVLVVDDERDSRDFVRTLLEDCGARVVTAASSREALEALLVEIPDIVLSDIGMPDEDGYQFIAKARELPGMRTVPAAALTAFARAEDRRRTLVAGFQMHLSKPVEPDELIAAVTNLARIKKSLL